MTDLDEHRASTAGLVSELQSSAFEAGLVEGHRLGYADLERVRREAAEHAFTRGREAERMFPRPAPEQGDRPGFFLGIALGVTIGAALAARKLREHAAIESAPAREVIEG